MTTHFERGDRLFKRRWFAAALWEWQQHLPVARRNPEDLARTFNAMSAALLEQGEAHQAYVKAELARDAASQLGTDHPQAFYAHLNGALAAESSGDLEVARARAEGALKHATSNELPSDRRVQVMAMFAYSAIESEQYDVANTWLGRAQELPRPTNQWRVRWALALDAAICLGALGNVEASESAFAEAVDLAMPGDLTNVYVERGWMRLRHGNVAGATADAKEVVEGLLASPAFLTLPDAADGFMLLSALARAHGEQALSSHFYMQGFAWLATSGWRAHLRRSTRSVAHVATVPSGHLDLPNWKNLVRVTEASTAGEHRGPGRPQRLGRAVHGVAGQFATHIGQDMLATAAVFLRLPHAIRTAAALPAQTLVRRLEHGRSIYDANVLRLLDSYDQALVEEEQPYPAVLERMTRDAGTSWDPRAVQRLVLAHAS